MSDLNEHNERIAGLVFKYLLRKLSEEERTELNEWIAASENNQVQFDEMNRRPELRVKLNEYNQVDTQKIWQKIADQVPAVNEVAEESTGTVRKGRVLWFRIAIAAAVIGIIVFAGWLYFTTGPQKEAAPQIVTTNDVAPGGNKAVLILSDGKKVILDEAQQGTVAQQGKTIINKTKEGELTYKANSPLTNDHSPLTYNTITTPRGGQYHVVLPDGSHVWLNAASSIHFPTQFTGKEREVKLSGEGYFEVFKDKKKPFRVIVAGEKGKENLATIEVMGTHFNVNAYADESYIETTLLEGSIQFTANPDPKTQNAAYRTLHPKLLLPGQQAILNKEAEKVSVINNEEAETAISWVKGVFHFEKADIGNVMRQLSRWYDVQIKYEGNPPQQTITGDVERNIPLSELLAILEKMGKARFSIQGRTVRVVP
jgi:transmembrane sensor